MLKAENVMKTYASKFKTAVVLVRQAQRIIYNFVSNYKD